MPRKKRSMFGKAKHKKLAEIVRIDTPSNARKSAKKLLRLFQKAKRRKTKVVIKRACVLARNRCLAIRKKKNLSERERKELLKVAKIYHKASKLMVLD